MVAGLKWGALGGILVTGLLVVAAMGEQPSVPVPPPVPAPVAAPAPVQIAPNLFPYAYYGYGLSRLGHTPYQVPYFALHPPVYYSYPVPRPYGYSPFAYPPGTMTPEVVTSAPVIIRNKYVPPKSAAPAREQVAVSPLRITNPYVTNPDQAPVASEKATVKASRGPQIIYPIAATEKL